ncbi:hypothetical protein QL285_051968 [Trifolium repens]|nr:hypothetical protein QL285_051968 [Trifolium repens]
MRRNRPPRTEKHRSGEKSQVSAAQPPPSHPTSTQRPRADLKLHQKRLLPCCIFDELPPPTCVNQDQNNRETQSRRKQSRKLTGKSNPTPVRKHGGVEGWLLLVAPPPPSLT